jgi:hypothetical protein
MHLANDEREMMNDEFFLKTSVSIKFIPISQLGKKFDHQTFFSVYFLKIAVSE